MPRRKPLVEAPQTRAVNGGRAIAVRPMAAFPTRTVLTLIPAVATRPPRRLIPAERALPTLRRAKPDPANLGSVVIEVGRSCAEPPPIKQRNYDRLYQTVHDRRAGCGPTRRPTAEKGPDGIRDAYSQPAMERVPFRRPVSRPRLLAEAVIDQQHADPSGPCPDAKSDSTSRCPARGPGRLPCGCEWSRPTGRTA